jgi:dephospho-CoA kinase
LLFETNFQSLVDRTLAVDCPSGQQIRRLMKRDNIDETLAHSMLKQQFSNAERLQRADDVIDNGEDDVDLASQVAALHHSYTILSANK